MKKEEVLKKNEVITYLNNKWGNRCDSLHLTGGAVIDILEGRNPKDYDFILSNKDNSKIFKEAESLGLKYKYSSATSITFDLDGVNLQILRKSNVYFPFTIEKSLFSIKTLTFKYFDDYSFDNKILIPNDNAFRLIDNDNFYNTSKTSFKDRIKKWESKGYRIHQITRYSYLNICESKTFIQKIKDIFFTKESTES